MFIIPQTMVLTKTARVQEIQSIVGGPGGISPMHYFFTQFRVMITYIRLLVLPFNLNLDYDYPIYKSFFELPVLTSFLCITAILYSAKLMFSKYRLLSFSICWFFLTLLPESSILPQEDVIFEHRLYLPMVGFCIFLASGIYYVSLRGALISCEVIFKRTTQFAVLILSLLIAFYSILTYQRNKIWINETVLWQDIVQKSPHKARPYINRGWAYYNQGNFAQAMSDYKKAIAISPEFIYPYDDEGLIYAKESNLTQAIAEYDQAIRINPYYAIVYYHRGLAYFKQNNYTQALSDYNNAIKLNPEYVDAYNERAKLTQAQDNLTQANFDYTRSLKIDPDQKDIQAKISSVIARSKTTKQSL
jgi:tetratricopeptide (TPR) repeat protein